MREIKFRYRYEVPWGEKRKIVVGIYSLQQIETGGAKPYKGISIISRDEFTGLKDKNGKEIYEKDIVAIWPEDARLLRLVVFDFGWELWPGQEPKIDDIDFLGNYTSDSIKVVGNQYENPELLPGGENKNGVNTEAELS